MMFSVQNKNQRNNGLRARSKDKFQTLASHTNHNNSTALNNLNSSNQLANAAQDNNGAPIN